MQEIRKYRVAILFLTDVLIICASAMISEFLLANNNVLFTLENRAIISNTIMLSLAVYEAMFLFFNTYKNITRYENGKDYIIYILLSILSGTFVFLLKFLFALPILGLKQIILSTILIAVSIVSYRVIIRFILTSTHHTHDTNNEKKNLLIIGAGEAAKEIIKTLKTSMRGTYNIVGLIDDNPNKINFAISGVKILGNRYKIQEICKLYKVDTIFFSIANIKNIEKREIVNICQETGAKLRILPGTADIINNKGMLQNLRDVEIDDILGREPIALDYNNIEELIKDKCILVTGGRRFHRF